MQRKQARKWLTPTTSSSWPCLIKLELTYNDETLKQVPDVLKHATRNLRKRHMISVPSLSNACKVLVSYNLFI